MPLRQIIADDETPFYRMILTENDLVIFRSRTTKTTLAPSIKLPECAEDKGREIAREKAWDYNVLCSNWLEMTTEEATKGNPPKNTGAAFIGYCKKQEILR